jgi:hypothetical protein
MNSARRKKTPKNRSRFSSSYFATGTLGALRFIVTDGRTAGRKSVILFSDGFKL